MSFGENQYQKILSKNREKYINLIKPTLTNPIFIIKDKNGGYLFIKSFITEDKKIYFNSVVVNIENKNIIISNHQVKLNKIVNRIFESGKILFPVGSFSAVPTFENEPQHEATLSFGNYKDSISQNISKLQEILYKDLEISILKFSEILNDNDEFRINSEFFRKKYIQTIDKIKNMDFQYLQNLYFFNGRYKQPIYNENSSLKIINSQYIRDYFIDYENAKKGIGNIVPKKAVLINSTGVGTLGRVNIHYLDEDFSVDNHVNVIVTNNLNPYYLMSFLKSKYGQNLINRYYSGSSGQIEIYAKNFDKFVIPIFSNTFQSQIENFVKTAYEKLKESKKFYKEAESLLLEELDLKDFTPTNKNITIKNLSESFTLTGRLDSEYYQAKYDEVIEKIKSYKGGYCKLSDIAITIRGSLISDEYYSNKGVPYIRGADISSNILNKEKMIYINSNFIFTKEIKVITNDIIFSLIGSVGTLAVVTEEFNNSYISNNLGLIRIINDKISANCLHLILISNKIGKYYFEQKQMKTAQPKISDKDVQQFIIPIIEKNIQTQIEQKIKESFKLKKESKNLLDLAVKSVEVAIEKGENKGMELIKEKI